MSANNAGINIKSFFLYNSVLGPKEGEECKKILFFHPQDTDIDTQIRTVGLCEAVVKFTQTFNPSKPCEALHTQKTKQFFLQAEENFWIIMTLTVPYSVVAEEGQQRTEYHGDDVQDHVYLSILRMSYLLFRFFQGPIQSILNRSDVQNVRHRLNHFYSRYLLNLRLDKADLSDVFYGIYFLPLDKITFLKVQCFVNLVEATFSQVKHVVFLYNEQLVWSGLEQDDMHVLYRYLVSSLFPLYMESELQLGSLSPAKPNLPSFSQAHYGRFVTGPPNVNDAANLGKVPKAHINIAAGEEECHLVVYRALSASVCLLINSSFQLSMEFYKKLDNFLGPQLTSLASAIADINSRKPNNTVTEQQFKYIYFNHMNLAQKSTLKCGGSKNSANNVPSSVMRLLVDVNSDLKSIAEVGEIFMKSVSGCWVVGKTSDQRELYVFINDKNANLMDVNEEVKKICATQFDNIFTID